MIKIDFNLKNLNLICKVSALNFFLLGRHENSLFAIRSCSVRYGIDGIVIYVKYIINDSLKYLKFHLKNLSSGPKFLEKGLY